MDKEKAKQLIGSRYNDVLNDLVKAYRLGNYVIEKELLKQAGGFLDTMACFNCLNTIKEKHLKFYIDGEIRTHNNCIESLANNL